MTSPICFCPFQSLPICLSLVVASSVPDQNHLIHVLVLVDVLEANLNSLVFPSFESVDILHEFLQILGFGFVGGFLQEKVCGGVIVSVDDDFQREADIEFQALECLGDRVEEGFIEDGEDFGENLGHGKSAVESENSSDGLLL